MKRLLYILLFVLVITQSFSQGHTNWWWVMRNLNSPAFNIVILNIGQSNAAGAAGVNRLEALTTYRERPSNVKRFVKGAGYFSTSDDGGWYHYVSYKTHNQMPSLAKLINTRLNRNVYVIEAALSGSSMATKAGTFNDWKETNTSDCYEQATLHHFTPAIAKLPTDREYKVVICWHQGEADGTIVNDYNNYGTNFTAMITALRAYHPKLAEAPLLISKVHYNLNAGETVINNFFTTYCSNTSNNAYFVDPSTVTYPRNQDLTAGEKATYPPDGYSDDQHNSHYFQIEKGILQYNKLVDLNFIPVRSAESGYDRDVKDWVLKNQALGNTIPSANNLSALSVMINSLKTTTITGNNSLWKKCIALYPFANDGSSGCGLISLTSNNLFNATLVNAPTWTSNQGFTFNGTTQYINSGCLVGTTFASFNSTWYNDLSVGELVHSIATKIGFGIFRAGAGSDFYLQGTAGGSSGRCWNSSAVAPLSGFTTAARFIAIARNNSANWDYYIDATRTNVVHARVGSNTGAVRFGNDGGANYGDETCAVGFIFQGLTEAEMLAVRTIVLAYKSSL